MKRSVLWAWLVVESCRRAEPRGARLEMFVCVKTALLNTPGFKTAL